MCQHSASKHFISSELPRVKQGAPRGHLQVHRLVISLLFCIRLLLHLD